MNSAMDTFKEIKKGFEDATGMASDGDDLCVLMVTMQTLLEKLAADEENNHE